MAASKRSTKRKLNSSPAEERLLLNAFRAIPSGKERSAVILIAEGIAFGKLTK